MPMPLYSALRTAGLSLTLFTGALPGLPAMAQTPAAASPTAAAAAPSLTAGEVRKIDRDAGKITLKHGEIKHLDMPPMTMVFLVKDKALLDKVTVGARIQFMARYDNGQMTVTEIQPAP